MSEPVRRSPWSIVGLVALCGHCALGGLFALFGLFGIATVPVFFGINFNYIWPPVAILGGFALYLWSGRETACPVPEG